MNPLQAGPMPGVRCAPRTRWSTRLAARPFRSLLFAGIGVLSVVGEMRVAAAEAAPGRLRLTVLHAGTPEPVPCRVHLRDAAGKAVRPPSLPFWHDHFVCEGSVEIALPAGSYAYTIERGPEYEASTGQTTLAAGATVSLTNQLRRLADLSREGWWSGDLHVHRPLADIRQLMRAEDLHLAPVITWWNSRGPWASNPPPAGKVVRFDDNRFYAPLGGEDERGGGALLYFGLDQPLPLDRLGREYPASTVFLREAAAHPAAWIDIEKPFWWDTPIWLATGLADSVGIANNHQNRGGMLDNEAWGRPRDRAAYPAPWGNGLYTQDLYYRILNAGFRLPPSAGSASGVLPNPVGYNRAYVHLEGPLTWESWWDGLRAGRVFVGNGPLLRVRANGQWPGHVFRSDGPLTLMLDPQVDSREPLAALEIVRNGRVERMPSPSRLTVHESGWFLVRAIADVTNTFRFASTGPWYVEIGDRPPPVRREAAQFFLDWVRERKAAVTAALPDAAQRDAALQPVDEAQAFWQERVAAASSAAPVTGEIVDGRTGAPLAARVYVRRQDGRWFFPESLSPAGTAIRYERRNGMNTNAVEFHTTLSAHPFRLALEPGRYTIEIERGKEYRPLVREFAVGAAPVPLRLPLDRWVDMAARGWYSGDTHVHRPLDELPTLLAAEDLNVAFPLTYWVTRAFAPPEQGDKNTDAGSPEAARLGVVDPTHVFWPRNTEYEIFSVNGRSHTLGAVFILGHRDPLTRGVPPVGFLAAEARRQGALLDLDKHNWPWSMAIVPLLGVDLYELANNHHWRTAFGITNWAAPAAPWMEGWQAGQGDERDWTRYTFQNYYVLLNCGFRLRPTAGTASGVHPVPLGFGRVYVHLPDGFRYDDWLRGLDAGRSFVTTGPMLLTDVTADRLTGTVLSDQPVREIEIVVNGDVLHRLPLAPQRNTEGAWEGRFRQDLRLDGTSWVAVRCWEEHPEGRFRFAHTAPRWFDVPDRPLRPRRREADYLVRRVREELDRAVGVLPESALEEYRRALATYTAIAETSRP